MPSRSYRQYCAFARSLDVLGDRWTLLIVRNLLLGPQTWSELRAGLPGVAKNLLAERVKQLGADGVVFHEDEMYGLTEQGQELEEVVFALGNWGERHLMGPPQDEDEFRLRYLMTSVRRKLKVQQSERTLQIVVEGQPFWVRLGAAPTVEQGRRDADASLFCTLPWIRALLFGRAPLKPLVDDPLVRIEGDANVIEEFRKAL